MKVYVPDQTLFVFDVVPPRQYLGAAAYRKDWEDFLSDLDGPIKFDITDLAVVADGNLGYSHSIQHVSGKNKKGRGARPDRAGHRCVPQDRRPLAGDHGTRLGAGQSRHRPARSPIETIAPPQSAHSRFTRGDMKWRLRSIASAKHPY